MEKIKNTLIKNFHDCELIQFDEDSNLVISKRKRYYSKEEFEWEYMVHHFILNEKEPNKSSLESGNYCSSFETAIFKYLQRKEIRLNLDLIEFTQNDIDTLREGDSLEWGYPTDEGIYINVNLKRDEDF